MECLVLMSQVLYAWSWTYLRANFDRIIKLEARPQSEETAWISMSTPFAHPAAGTVQSSYELMKAGH